jgi:anti-anti-sigma regulatory factor
VLRIDKVYENLLTVKLKLEGTLVGEWVLLLEEKILECLENNKKVLLDFSELRFVDEHGMEMLRRLPPEKIAITNCPRFIEELLKG